MSCHVMSCHVMSCHVMPCHVMSSSINAPYPPTRSHAPPRATHHRCKTRRAPTNICNNARRRRAGSPPAHDDQLHRIAHPSRQSSHAHDWWIQEPTNTSHREIEVGRTARGRAESETQTAGRSRRYRVGAFNRVEHMKNSFVAIKTACPSVSCTRFTPHRHPITRMAKRYTLIGSSQSTETVRFSTWRTQAKFDYLSTPLLRHAHNEWGGLDTCMFRVLARLELPDDAAAAKTALRIIACFVKPRERRAAPRGSSWKRCLADIYTRRNFGHFRSILPPKKHTSRR
jgi:hypothetical protein